MPFCSPRSSSGKTSGLSRLNMRNISAVQRPMPRTSTSSAMISSSVISGQRCTWIEPFAKCCARSAMYSVLRSESPQARSAGRGRASTPCGVICPTQATSRFHTLCAAFTEICCPTIARASVKKGSPRGARKTFGCARMMSAITGSRRASARFARSQYSGFIERQVGEQVLRLHAHHAFLVRREGEVDGAPCDIGTHGARIVELERKEREDALHSAMLDLGAGPQIVQDGRGLRVEADVPGPMWLVDAADRFHAHCNAEEVMHPQADHRGERVECRAAVGQADHRVVARLALPVERGVGAIEHIEIQLAERAARFDDQAANAAVAAPGGVQLHRLAIGEQRMPFLDGCLLLAKEDFRRAQL